LHLVSLKKFRLAFKNKLSSGETPKSDKQPEIEFRGNPETQWQAKFLIFPCDFYKKKKEYQD
jgi:hypothetical protein